MLDPTIAYTYFNYLYNSIDGYSVSHQARIGFNDKNEVLYGEVPPETWLKIMTRVDPKMDGVFLDIGSGTGRVVVLSHLLGDFKKSLGVELLQGLYQKSCEVKEQFEREVQPRISNHIGNRELSFLCQDIMQFDLTEVDFIFMNHPFKDRDLFVAMENKMLSELKSGTKIVTTIRALDNSAFKNLGSEKYEFSWGESTAYFYEV